MMPDQIAFGALWKEALPDRISNRLLALISERQLRPGDRLPSERELAATMGVSRPVLREALRALAVMNVVEIRQGSGTYVTSLRPELLIEHLDFVFSLDTSTFLQLFEARKILEVEIARLAAERITDEQIARLEACMEHASRTIGDAEEFQEADLELHQLIAAAAANPILERLMTSLSRLGLASRRRTTSRPGVPQQAVEDHHYIVEAIKRRDPDAAHDAMLAHLLNIGRALVSGDPGEDLQPTTGATE